METIKKKLKKILILIFFYAEQVFKTLLNTRKNAARESLNDLQVVPS
jgi:hypothetical protein